MYLHTVESNTANTSELFADGLSIRLNPNIPGSCLFASVSDQLLAVCHDDTSHVDLRRRCVEFMRKNPHFIDDETHVINFIHGTGNTDKVTAWNNYLLNLEKHTTFGDNIALQAMAKFLQVQFLVMSKKKGQINTHLITPSQSYQQEIPLLFLGHYDESESEHYVSLDPVTGHQLTDLMLSVRNKSMMQSITKELNYSDLDTNEFPTNQEVNIPEISSASEQVNDCCDIGLLIANGCDVRDLRRDQLLSFVEFVHEPRETSYPTTMMNGCLRRFKPSWLSEHPWLLYSSHCNGVFCRACVLFGPKEVSFNKLRMFVSTPFTKWTKKTESCRIHAQNQYHLDAMARLSAFKETLKKPEETIDRKLDKEKAMLAARNRNVLTSLFQIVMLCGRQGIAFRGHVDDRVWGDKIGYQENHDTNQGNFIELVKFRACTDQVLADHLKSAPLNAHYTSKTIQNEMIDVVGEHIRNALLDDIKEATFYSVMADEVTDVSNNEQVSISARYVNSQLEAKEVFLDIVDTERITGQALSELIITRLKKWGLQLENLRGQAYDGASNMAGKKNGCQAKITEKAPLAFYMHCAAHQLNLSVVSSCGIPAVKNAQDTMSEISRFFFIFSKAAGFI